MHILRFYFVGQEVSHCQRFVTGFTTLGILTDVTKQLTIGKNEKVYMYHSN